MNRGAKGYLFIFNYYEIKIISTIYFYQYTYHPKHFNRYPEFKETTSFEN